MTEMLNEKAAAAAVTFLCGIGMLAIIAGVAALIWAWG